MGVTSITQVQNSTLTKLGAEHIVNEDDESTRARLLKAQTPIIRDKLLRSHPWKFAIERVALVLITPHPTDQFTYSYAFQLPADCLRVLETDMHPLAEWAVEGRVLVANVSSVKIKYIKKVTDVTKWDDNFCEVLAYELALDVAYAFNQSLAQKEDLRKEHKLALQEARSFNAQQGSVQRVISDEWLDSRY